MNALLLAVSCALSLPLQVVEQAAPEGKEKPAPVKVLGREFPFGESYRPGRWFPLEITVQAEKAWEGILWVQLHETGPIFEKTLKLEEKERRTVSIAVLPGAVIQGIAVDVGGSLAKFAGPSPSESLRVLLIGSPTEAEEMKTALFATPSLASYLFPIGAATVLGPERLPTDLYFLDVFDLICLSDSVARTLSAESKDLLLRWAVIRGRLFTTEAGKKSMKLDAASGVNRESWVEVVGENPGPTARRFPTRLIAPNRLSPLQTKHFARVLDPAFLVLLFFGTAFSLLLFLRRNAGPWSRAALLAGGCTVLLVIPGIGWPGRTPPWRSISMEEGMPGWLIEDRVAGKSLPLELDGKTQLLLPRPDHSFIVEWHEGGRAKFFLLEGERRLFQAQFLEGRQIHRSAEGALRNGFAPLESVAFLFAEQSQASLLDRWDSGEALPGGKVLGSEQGLRQWPRPLRDFLGAPWVSGAWLMARVTAQDPTPAGSPFGASPGACYLLWFPKLRN